MDRLDYFDIRPAGLDAYLSNYGYHFSKAMFEFATKKMRDRNGNKLQVSDKASVENTLKANNITIENDKGYDVAYVFNKAKSKCFGSSIMDEAHLAKSVKDYLDDKYGYDGIAFSHFYADCVAQGVPILWEEML